MPPTTSRSVVPRLGGTPGARAGRARVARTAAGRGARLRRARCRGARIAFAITLARDLCPGVQRVPDDDDRRQPVTIIPPAAVRREMPAIPIAAIVAIAVGHRAEPRIIEGIVT